MVLGAKLSSLGVQLFHQMEYTPSLTAKAAAVASANGLETRNKTSRFSVAALWSMAAENDAEVEDELTKCTQTLDIFSAKTAS